MDYFENEFLKYYSLKSNKERILLVGHMGDEGGAEILLKNIISELIKQDVEVVVFVKKDGLIIDSYKKMVPTFIIDLDEKMEISVKQLSEYNFKTAILNTVITANFLYTLKKYGFYTLCLVHELPGVIKVLKAEKLAKDIEKYGDTVIFPSDFVSKKFREFANVNNQMILPQGFYNKYDNFNHLKSRKKLEKKHNISYDNYIILNVGLGEKRKGFDLFVDVYNKLKNKNYTFIWVGYISEDVKYCIKDINEDNLILTNFIEDKEELMSYYGAADLFLLTSREDPFPSVVFEAFNAKLPVIGFENAGGFQDIVADNQTGYLVDYESADALVEKIEFLCSNPKLKEKLGENAKKVCENYSFEEYVSTLKALCFKNQHKKSILSKIKKFSKYFS